LDRNRAPYCAPWCTRSHASTDEHVVASLTIRYAPRKPGHLPSKACHSRLAPHIHRRGRFLVSCQCYPVHELTIARYDFCRAIEATSEARKGENHVLSKAGREILVAALSPCGAQGGKRVSNISHGLV